MVWEFAGAHNTVGQMSAPTTLLGFFHARKVVRYPSDMPYRYCPAGVQDTVLGIAVDLSALPYFLRPFPGPYRVGVPGRLVPVGSVCASRRGAVSRGSAHSRSKKRVRVGSGVLARPSGQRGCPKAGRSWKRALFLLSEAFRSERRARVRSERLFRLSEAFRSEIGLPFWPVV